MKDKDLSNTSRTNWSALSAMSDEDIDYSDIPPLTDGFFESATLRIPTKQSQNPRGLHSDSMQYFKEQQEERKDLYQKTREDLLKRQLSNTENFDRSILTLSTTILGLTLTFIKNITPLEEARFIFLLISAWVLLVTAVIVTLISFQLSQAGTKIQIRYAEKYYLEEQNEYLTKNNTPAILTEWAGYVSAITFIVAMIFLVAFVSFNIR